MKETRIVCYPKRGGRVSTQFLELYGFENNCVLHLLVRLSNLLIFGKVFPVKSFSSKKKELLLSNYKCKFCVIKFYYFYKCISINSESSFIS